MSEQKRVPLQSLGTTKKEKKGEDFCPSFRFTLTLPESNEKACPEFNYRELLKSAEKKRKKDNKRGDENATNGLDPHDDDDEEKLREMAKRFEAKYGTTPSGKSRRGKYTDYIDLGAGYDESDSFIDNTDAYDEIVPEEITTVHGGFYINCGALEFKSSEGNSLIGSSNNNNNNNNVEDESTESSEEDTDKPDSPNRSHKRALSSSEDEDTEEVDQPVSSLKKAKLDDNVENVEKSGLNEATYKKKKQELLMRRKNTVVRDLLKVKREAREVESQEDLEDKKKSDKVGDVQKSKSLLEKKFDIKRFEKKAACNGLEVRKPELKKGGGKETCYDDAIESVVNAARGVDDESSLDTMDSGKSRGIACSDSECDETMDKEEAPLPESLTEDMKEIVNKLKQHAETSKEGKTKFFNGPINSGLFSLEKKLRLRCSPSERLQVYAHLAHFLPCSKATLVNRAKKLYLQDVEDRVKSPLERLKAAIDRIMPSVMVKYTRDCQRVADEKGLEGSPSDGESTEGEENGGKSSDKSKIPQRKFPWSDETKRLVAEIANARRDYFEILKPRKESVESFVSSYLDAKVRPLWPPGWVQLETLVKYSTAQPPAKKKLKKPKETSVPSIVQNSTTKGTMSSTNAVQTVAHSAAASVPERESSSKTSGVDPSTVSSSKSIEANATTNSASDKKSASKHRDKSNRESPGSSSQNSPASNSSVSKISVVPASQLMSVKSKTLDKFNPMDLTSGSLSITPVTNDFHKSKAIESQKTGDPVDSVSITPCSESPNDAVSISPVSNFNQQPASSAPVNQKPVPLKHRILQESLEVAKEERIVEKECKTERRDKERKEKRSSENKHKHHDKKRKREHRIQEQPDPVKQAEPTPLSRSSLTKEEQEQRQIEETMAATNFLSQIINSDEVPRPPIEKRKEVLDEATGAMVQPSEQENDVQMVMRSLKELQELQEMKYSPSHSPVSVIQKPSKSSANVQYANYPDDYQHLYHKKDDKMRVAKKEDAQW